MVHAVVLQFLLLLLGSKGAHHNNRDLTNVRIWMPADIFEDLPAAFQRQQEV